MSGIRKVKGRFYYRDFKTSTEFNRAIGIIARVGAQRWANSFANGGGQTDASKGGWRPRKSGRDVHPILVKSGKLFRAVRVRRRTAYSVTWGTTGIPYAARHNDGLSGMPQREFIGDSQEFFRDIENILDKIVIPKL